MAPGILARRLGAAALLATLVGVLAACSGANQANNSSAGQAQQGAAPGQAEKAAPGQAQQDYGKATTGGQGTTGGTGTALGRSAADQRAIIFTGSITVRVADVSAVAVDIDRWVTAAGGYVGGDKRTWADGRESASLTLRVPSAKFGSIVDEISRSGTELNRALSTQDVTAQVIDLAARIQTAQASVNRVRALLAKAQTLSDITTIEAELARREADLESLQAQQRDLNDLTTLSTITVNLLAPDAPAPVAVHHPDPGFMAGLKAGWVVFKGVVRVTLVVIGALLPFVAPAGAVLLAIVWLRRLIRRYRPRVALVGPAAGAGGPGTAAGTPGAVPGTPGTAAGTPGAVPGTPGTAAGTPGAVPGTPGAGVRAERPDP